MPTSSDLSSPVILHHLGYRFPDDGPQLNESFQCVRFVLLCGTPSRARDIARRFKSTATPNLCRTDRYYLVQPIPTVLVAAHGIGTGSIDVLLHEIYILLTQACAREWCFVRLGSCGGVGVPPGTLVVTRRVVNGGFRPVLRLFVLGKETEFPAELNGGLSERLLSNVQAQDGVECIYGDTLCAETFHIAQGRRDGGFCTFSKGERMAFLEKCRDSGIVNLEMESLALGAFGTKVNIPTAVVCVVLVDRLEQETPSESEGRLAGYQKRAVDAVVNFVVSELH